MCAAKNNDLLLNQWHKKKIKKNNESDDTSVMVALEKGSASATYYAAGNLNITNCANQTGIQGIYMDT